MTTGLYATCYNVTEYATGDPEPVDFTESTGPQSVPEIIGNLAAQGAAQIDVHDGHNPFIIFSYSDLPGATTGILLLVEPNICPVCDGYVLDDETNHDDCDAWADDPAPYVNLWAAIQGAASLPKLDDLHLHSLAQLDDPTIPSAECIQCARVAAELKFEAGAFLRAEGRVDTGEHDQHDL